MYSVYECGAALHAKWILHIFTPYWFINEYKEKEGDLTMIDRHALVCETIS